MIEEPNGNGVLNPKRSNNNATTAIALPTSPSTDDLSQSLSLSEYTDADESMSAPTEFLAEFLSAVMLKDYVKALKYCKLILDFEPNNITAREFYPLIEEKLRRLAEHSASDDENYNNESSPEEDGDDIDGACGDISSDDSEYSSDDNNSDSDEKFEDVSNKSISSINTTESENTTHSYSNSLLEDEEGDDVDDADEANIAADELDDNTTAEYSAPDLSDFNNGNYKIASCSDSESPTEPLTQKIASIFRSGFTASVETK